MTPADFAAHVVAPAIEDISEGDATVTVITETGIGGPHPTVVVRTGPGDEYRLHVLQTRQASGREEG